MTSVSPRIDKRRRTYVRLMGEIHHALNQALNDEKAKRGLNMTQIGKMLGVGRSAISKKFDGRHNLTLETLADLAFALDRPVKFSLPERVVPKGSNQYSSAMLALANSVVSPAEPLPRKSAGAMAAATAPSQEEQRPKSAASAAYHQ